MRCDAAAVGRVCVDGASDACARACVVTAVIGRLCWFRFSDECRGVVV